MDEKGKEEKLKEEGKRKKDPWKEKGQKGIQLRN